MRTAVSDPLVSIVIVARDEEANLGRCLSAIREQEAGFEYEIVMVDSGSRDRTVEVARSFGARVIEIPRSSFQHGRTRQMASEQARGEYLVYIVADAAPADERWLATLVDAVASDDGVAGAYSRQVPRDGAGPVEAYRIRHRLSSGIDREVREIGPGLDFWALTAEERFNFCEFDDVSCCRRASTLKRFPIPEVDWAEDLLWAREVLLAGHGIVFEPASVVKHSHPDTIAHAFRRGYLDQDVVKRGFGVLYFDNVGSILRGYPRMFAEQARAIFECTPRFAERARPILWNAARLVSEMAGNYMAAREPREGRVVHDLVRIMGGVLPSGVARKGHVLKTRFTVGDQSRPTLFMNPKAFASATLRVPADATLEFGAAINPAARPERKDPALFLVMVDGELAWRRWVGPGERDRKPEWTEGIVDLGGRAGRLVEITLATWAEDTDHAWAGWGSPRVVAPEPSALERAYNRLLGWVREKAMGEPLRHP